MIQIFNSAGQVRFDSELVNPTRVISGSFVTPSASNDPSYPETPGTQPSDSPATFVLTRLYLNSQISAPIIFIRPQTGHFVSVINIGIQTPARQAFGPTPGIYISFKAPPNITIDYRIYDNSVPAVLTSGYGAQVYNSAGALRFQSNFDVLTLVSAQQILGSGQVFSNYSPISFQVPSFSAFGGGLPFFYANDLIPTDVTSGGFLRCIAVRNDSLTQYSVRAMDVSGDSFFGTGDPIYKRPRILYRTR